MVEVTFEQLESGNRVMTEQESGQLQMETKMNIQRGGFSVLGALGVLVVLAAVVAGGLYTFSPFHRTQIASTWKEFSQWTPDNIAKYPVEYLNFCEEQTNNAVLKLKGSQIAISQKKAKLEAMREEATTSVMVGDKAMTELKLAYRKAETDNAWPLSWQGAQLDQDKAKCQAVKLDADIQTQESLRTQCEEAIKTLDVQLVKVRDARAVAKEQLAKIETNREMLKVQIITDELKKTLVEMKGAVESSVVGVASSTESGVQSLSDLTVKAQNATDEGRFDKIMAK